MWTSHLRLALRALVRDKTNAVLGGLSLAVAVAACVLIALFVRAELSYNRALPHADRLSAVATRSSFGGEMETHTSTPALLAPALVEAAPTVEAATVTFGGGREAPVVTDGDGPEQEVRVVVADSLFFDVFQHPFLAGDPATALDDPDGVVLTASAAQRLFGTATPLGEPLTLAVNSDTLAYTVRGVMADLPGRTTLDVEAVGAFGAWRAQNEGVGTGWGSMMYQTYALRRPGTAEGALQRVLDAKNETDEWGVRDARFLDVPLREFRLSEASYVADGFGGDALFVRLFAAVAGLILVLGAVNYVNLATARGARRAKEVGVQKALGAGRGLLVRQFLTESVVLSTLAAVTGLGLAALALPAFADTFGVELSLADLDPAFLVGLGGAAVVVGVLAGLYPAVYLSAFEPVRVLRGGAAFRAAGEAFLSRTWLRRGLVVFQFAAAVLLLVATGAVYGQLEYARSKPLGFEPDGLAVVEVTAPALRQQTEAIKAAFEASPAVVATAGASGVPPTFCCSMTDSPDPGQPDLDATYKTVDADPDYAAALGLGMAAGRWPDVANADDLARGVVVNEAFVDDLGWPSAEAAVGRRLREDKVVVGVTRDFHFESLRDPVSAAFLAPHRPEEWEREARGITGPAYGSLAVRFAPGREAEGLADVEAAWADLAPGAPFESRWVADDVAELSSDEERLAKTFGLFALVAVLIAAFGLVGLAAYSAERRTKEVGIRKVLGASVGGLVGLLSREYLALAAVAAAVALPFAAALVVRWHEGFAYHAPLSPLVLIGAAVAALVLAVVSVGVQAYRTARRDPVRALRSE